MSVIKAVEDFNKDSKSTEYYDVEEEQYQQPKSTKDAETEEEKHTRAISTAKKLLKMGIGTLEEIMEVTGLSLEEINHLKEEI